MPRWPALFAAALLAGCGSSEVPSRVPGQTLRIYLSVPLSGASSLQGQAVRSGAQLALADWDGRIGRYRVVLSVLNDSTAASDGWDPNQTTINARTAVQDPATVGYLGDLESGATAVSIPVLNHAGIAQVSPEAGAVGLTSAGSGASPGEPQKYYPTGIRTFARVVPSDAVEAAATVRLELASGCRAPYVLQDGEVDGEDDAISYVLAAQAAGLHVLGVQSFPRHAADYSSLATGVAGAGADCLLLAAGDERSAAALARQLAQAMPRARIFASGLLADAAFVDPRQGGIPFRLDRRVLVLSPVLVASADPRSAFWLRSHHAGVYRQSAPQAILGYAAMSLLLRAVSVATDRGRAPAVRSKVAGALLRTRGWENVLGRVSIRRDGDPSLRAYGVYRIVRGQLVFWRPVG